jgi:hypothetical protein
MYFIWDDKVMTKGTIKALICVVAAIAALILVVSWQWGHHVELMLTSYDVRSPRPERGEIYPYVIKGITVYGTRAQGEEMASARIAMYGSTGALLICAGIAYWLSRKPKGKAENA